MSAACRPLILACPAYERARTFRREAVDECIVCIGISIVFHKYFYEAASLSDTSTI